MRLTRLLSFQLVTAIALSAAPAWPQENPALQSANEAFKEGKYEAAASQYHAVLDSSGYEEDRHRAEYYLGLSLHKLGLHQSALYHWSQILKTGARHRFYAKAIEGLIDVAEAIRDDLIIPSLLNKEYNEHFAKLSPAYLHKVNFIIGEVSYRSGKHAEARDFLSENGAVPKESGYFARAQYLLGVIAGTTKTPDEQKRAAQYFERVRALVDTTKTTYGDLAELKELATLGLARVHYGMGRYGNAVAMYEQLPRFSTYWDEALFENGWARFMNDDPGGGMGSLEALHAPQFAGSFQPESWILKATIYHYACLYQEVNQTLARFDELYKPMASKIRSLVKGEKDFAYYYRLLQGEEIPKPVKNLLLGNKRLEGFQSYLSQLDGEKKRIEETRALRDGKMGAELLHSIDQQRAVLVSVAGKFIKGRMEDAAKQIEGFDATAEIIRLENSSREKESFEANIDRAQALQALKLYRPEVPGGTYEYWKFDGEFWIDEIGYYQYTLKKAVECKEGRLEKSDNLKAEK